jgi:WD40 repeat protein
LNKHDKGEYIFLSPKHELNLPPAPPLDESKNPYRGLEAFEEKHSEFFFGRSELVKELQGFIKDHTLTIVLGASGSGKSSLVKAGLIPKLRTEANEKWRILSPIRPGETPFQALNNALTAGGLASVELENQQKNLAQSVTTWIKNNPNRKLLIVIDQVEEIITLCQGEENEKKRKEFFQQILSAINAHRHQLRVVLTLRSDFEPQVRDAGLKYVPTALESGNTFLKRRWQSGRFIVPAMTRAELREAIEKPAETRVMYFEPHELVEELIDEVDNMPGALPLLSFALSQLYLKYLKRQRVAEYGNETIDRALTQADYEELGGVMQSLTQRADEEYQKLVNENSAYDQVIPHVMLRMIALTGGELARRRVPLSELEYPEEKNILVKQIIERFSKARLLVEGQDAQGSLYVEPAHDALVRGWEKLLAWKQKEEENLILQRRLTPAVADWQSIASQQQQASGFQRRAKPVINWLDGKLSVVENFFDKVNPQIETHFVRLWEGIPNGQEGLTERPSQHLWNGNPYLDVLDKTLNSDDNWLNTAEADFVRESVVHKKQNHKWRWRIASSVSSVIAITAIIASIQWINAQKRLISTIDALTEASQQLFDSNQEFDALLTSVRAGKQAKQAAFGVTPETEYRIKTQLQQSAYWVKERNRLDGHNGAVFSVSLSPDGQLLASGSADGNIKLWDVETGKHLNTLTGHIDAVNVVSFSPDGKLLASASDSDNTVRLWNIATGMEISFFKDYDSTHNTDSDSNGNQGITFSPDGRILAYVTDENNIKLLDVESGEINTLSEHKYRVSAISFSPDGKKLASASYDRKVKLWDIVTRKAEDTPISHNNWVFSVAFSPDGRMLASGADGGSIQILNILEGKVHPIKGFSGRVTNLSFSSDGQLLIASGFNNAIKSWDARNLREIKEIKPLNGHSAHVNSVSSNGQILASASDDGTIRLWDIGKRKEVNFLSERPTPTNIPINSVSFSPDKQLLATTTKSCGCNKIARIRLWDASKGKLIDTLRGHTFWIESLAFSSSGKLLASGGWDKTVKLWDVAKRKDIATLKGHSKAVASVVISPDEQILASGGRDNTIKLWDISNPKEPKKIANLTDHKNEVSSISFSSSGKLLASGSWDKTVKLWDITNPTQAKKIATLKGHDLGIRSVNFSPDSKLLASAGDDAKIKLWDVTNTHAPQEVDTLEGHKLIIRSVNFSPDGKLLVSASDDKTIRLWDVATRKEINILNGHRIGGVNSISFSPNGSFLASGDKSGQIAVWNYSQIMSNFTLDNLLTRSCNRVRDYLKNNSNVEGDRNLCN